MPTIYETDWEHVKGGRYRIICIAVDEDTLRPVVVYRDIATAATWTRPVDEFFDGRFRNTSGEVRHG